VEVAIIGSGLAALAAARALIRRGLKPVMLDAGLTIEPEIAAAVERMRAQTPPEWRIDDLDLISRNPTVEQPGIPRKLVFGSDYIYAQDHPDAGVTGRDIKASTTLAKGGFANAWGATILTASADDLADDWPIKATVLEPHYRAVMTWLPLSAQADGLVHHFPIHADKFSALDLPPQALALYRDLAHVDHSGLSFGQARLAVSTSGTNACRYCGQCLSGCVYGSIFNPATDVDELVSAGALEYRPGWIVLKLAECDNRVRVDARRLESSIIEELWFDRVFLAAGAISTTRIMLQSLDAYVEPVELKDSQKFVLPLFRRHAEGYALNAMNTLASIFVELRVPALEDNWIHIQVSTMNDFVLRRLRIDRNATLRRMLSPLLERTMVAWCSLHSRHSAALMAILQRHGSGTTFELEHTRLDRARTSVKKALQQLRGVAPRFKSFVLPSLVDLSAPGAGNHLGGSFPMRKDPQRRVDTDVLGRPVGFERLHIVDSAVMPSIPATPMALLMMANADRIASAAQVDG
jgi:choline dehydrogenase-like flavoprotein